MKPRRGRTIALWSAAAGVAVLVVSGFALKDRIREEYWVWKLEKGQEAEQIRAAEKLGELRSLRAVASLEAIRSASLDKVNKYVFLLRREIAAANAGLTTTFSPPILDGPNTTVAGLKLHTAAAEALRKIRGE